MSMRGWAKIIAIGRDAGRHRRGSGDPGCDLITQEVTEPSELVWPEPATGLGKFNLGTIPASVTPPRSWRRAAWFAVGTAAFVVCALGFASVALVGNPRKSTTIDALPEEPSQHLAITVLTTGESGEEPTAAVPTTAATVSGTTTHSGRTNGPAAKQATPAPPARSAQQQPHPPPARSTRPPTTEPTLYTAPIPLAQSVPPSLHELTEQYFGYVIRDPRAAHELTGGALRAEGPTGIQGRYAGVTRLVIKKISVHRFRSHAEAKLVLFSRDGRKKFAERRLTFSAGPEPRITSDTPS
ncbi:MAG TPA: hypothetical protein VFV67_13065 [Actinophytocola sp.]|uniref:hypothetical protein n=1 Tax=Actinophytocola sp. TaxID=1872138 RepID=UPI002DB6CE0D|nr:hypothetical protein [Actinophytocola sp.]HEU5471577.1 hypothetical protein [Actinophytocola sp.]